MHYSLCIDAFTCRIDLRRVHCIYPREIWMNRRISAAIGGLLLAGAGVLLFAASADAVYVCTAGACADENSNWQGVSAHDTACEGNGVYVNYARVTGGNQVQNNYLGCNTFTYSGTDANLVSKMQACRNTTLPDNCSNYVYR